MIEMTVMALAMCIIAASYALIAIIGVILWRER